MKNLLVASSFGCKNKEKILTAYLRCQVDNSLRLGWSCTSMEIYTDFEFKYKGVLRKPLNINIPTHIGTNLKSYCLEKIFEKQRSEELYWVHDLDAWQTVPFDREPTEKKIGVCLYGSHQKINGGSVFYRPSALPYIREIRKQIEKKKAKKEEPIMTKIILEDTKNVEILNCTYNVGSKFFEKRYALAIKPVKVVHFKPTKKQHWEKFTKRYPELVPKDLQGVFESQGLLK